MAGKLLPVRGADGKLYEVPSSKLDSLPEGAQPLSAEEFSRAKAEEKYGGLANQATAFGTGLVGGPTLGLSDAAIAKFASPETREYIDKSVEANPYYRFAGDVGGIVGTEVLSGGLASEAEGAAATMSAGRLARGAAKFAPSSLVGGLGRAAARGTEALLGGEAEGVLARMAQKGLTHATQGALEGAAYGAGGQLTEDMLGDHDLTAEKFAAAAGNGMLLGGVLGGGLGAGGEAVSAAVRKGAEHLSPRMEKAAGEMAFRSTEGRKIFVQQAEAMGGVHAVGDTLMEEAGIKAGDTVEHVATKARAAAERSGERLGAMRSEADRLAYEGPRVADIASAIDEHVLSDLSKMPETNASVIKSTRRLLSDLDAIVGIDPASLELPKPPKEPKFWKELPPLEGVAPEASASDLANAHIDRLKSLIDSNPIGGTAVEQKQLAKLTKYADELASHETEVLKAQAANIAKQEARLTFEQAQEFRKNIDNLIRWNKPPPGSPPSAKMEAFKSFRGVFEKETEDALDRAASKSGQGGPQLAELKAEKLKYRRLNLAANAAEDSVERRTANNIISLRDTIIGSGGISSAAHAALTGHPVLAAVGLASPFLSKLVRDRGASTAAVLLKKASRLGALSAANNAATNTLKASVNDFFSRASTKSVNALVPVANTFASAKDLENRYNDSVEKLGELASSPEVMQNHLEQNIANIGAEAPRVADAMNTAAVRAVNYLQGLIPKAPGVDTAGLMPHLHHQPPSQSQMASFMRSVLAVENPAGVMRDFAHDKVSQEAVDALKACYPKFLNEIQHEVYPRLAELKTPLPIHKRTQLSRLLGMPVDATMTFDYISSVQNTFNSGGAPEGPRPSQAPQNLASDAQTSIEAASFGGGQ